jgi:hypothetical protein
MDEAFFGGASLLLAVSKSKEKKNREWIDK